MRKIKFVHSICGCLILCVLVSPREVSPREDSQWLEGEALTLFAAEKLEWLGTVYPSARDLTVYKHIGMYNTLEECRAAVSEWVELIKETSGLDPDYECGYRCKPLFPNLEDSVLVCKETLK